MKHVVFALLSVLLLTATARAGDFTISPSMHVSEEYNDNVNEERNGEGDMVTILKPGVGMAYESARIQTSVDYVATLKHYLQGKRTDETGHDLDGKFLMEGVEDLLYLSVTDRWTQVYRQTVRGSTPTEGEGYNDLVQQNTFEASPYLKLHLSDRTEATTGYKYSNIAYSDSETIDKNIHTGYLDLDHWLTEIWRLQAGYEIVDQNPDSKDNGFIRQRVYVGSRYDYSEGSYIYGKLGPAITKYNDSESDTSSTLAWDAGINHQIDTVSVGFHTEVSYEEVPDSGRALETRSYVLSLSKAFLRTQLTGTLGYYVYDTEENGDTERWSPGFTVSHELSDRLNLEFSTSADFESADTENTTRLYANTSLQYQLAEDYTGEVYYGFKNSFSDEDRSLNYSVNQIGLGITAHF